MGIAIGRGFPSREQRTMPHPAINKTCPRLLRPRERSAAAFGRETFEIRTTHDFHPGWDTQFIKRRPCAGAIDLRPAIIKCRFTRIFGECECARARARTALLSMEYIWLLLYGATPVKSESPASLSRRALTLLLPVF